MKPAACSKTKAPKPMSKPEPKTGGKLEYSRDGKRFYSRKI